MLRTNWRELTNASVGAFVGVALPLMLQWRAGDGEAWGMPLAVFAVPGFFLGAIVGVCFTRPK